MAVRENSQIFQPSFSLAILKFRQMKNFPWKSQPRIFFRCRVLDYYSPCSLGKKKNMGRKEVRREVKKGKGKKKGGAYKWREKPRKMK